MDERPQRIERIKRIERIEKVGLGFVASVIGAPLLVLVGMGWLMGAEAWQILFICSICEAPILLNLLLDRQDARDGEAGDAVAPVVTDPSRRRMPQAFWLPESGPGRTAVLLLRVASIGVLLGTALLVVLACLALPIAIGASLLLAIPLFLAGGLEAAAQWISRRCRRTASARSAPAT